MKLTAADRMILENQRAIMFAMMWPGDAKKVLQPRLEETSAATIIKKPKRRKPRNTEACGPGRGNW